MDPLVFEKEPLSERERALAFWTVTATSFLWTMCRGYPRNPEGAEMLYHFVRDIFYPEAVGKSTLPQGYEFSFSMVTDVFRAETEKMSCEQRTFRGVPCTTRERELLVAVAATLSECALTMEPPLDGDMVLGTLRGIISVGAGFPLEESTRFASVTGQISTQVHARLKAMLQAVQACPSNPNLLH